MKRVGPVSIGLFAALLALWLLWPASIHTPEPAVPARNEAPAPRPKTRSGSLPPVEHEEPSGPVECELANRTWGGLDGVRIEEVDPDTLETVNVIQASVTDARWIRFTPQHATGQGRIWVGAEQPVIAGWIDGACLDLIDPMPWPRTRVPVKVENAALYDEVKVLYQHEGFPLTTGLKLQGVDGGWIDLIVGAKVRVVALAEEGDEAFQDELELEVQEDSAITLHLPGE